MSYVVYHIDSTLKMKYFSTESGAKRSTTCMNKNAAYTNPATISPNGQIEVPYAYTDEANYEKNIVKMKKVTNLMSGKEIEIPSNTPHCCDPSQETYWSM